jgi:hypothetical protein
VIHERPSQDCCFPALTISCEFDHLIPQTPMQQVPGERKPHHSHKRQGENVWPIRLHIHGRPQNALIGRSVRTTGHSERKA